MPKYISCRVIKIDIDSSRIYIMCPILSKEIMDITGPFNLLVKVTYKRGYIKKRLPKIIPIELFPNAIVAGGALRYEILGHIDSPEEKHVIDEAKILNLWCSSSQCLLRTEEENNAEEKIKDYIKKLSNMP